jgi:hypothetical protein
LKKTNREIIKEPSTVPQPIMLTNPLDKYFLPNPLIKNPINGRRGIQNIKFFILNLQVPLITCRQLLAAGTGEALLMF